MEIPKGYTLDPLSGKYYHVLSVRDPQSGATSQLVTWFDPETGAYTRISEQTGEVATPSPSVSIKGNKSSTKSKTRLIILTIIALLLLTVLSVGALQLGLIGKSPSNKPVNSMGSSSSKDSEKEEKRESDDNSENSKSSKSSSSSIESSSRLPTASEWLAERSSSSSESPYTAPTTGPDNLMINAWYSGFVEREFDYVIPITSPLLIFWEEGRFTFSYEYLKNKSSLIGTTFVGSYIIDNNQIICTPLEIIEDVPTQKFTPEDFDNFIFEVVDEDVVCVKGDPRVPFEDIVFIYE